MGAPNFSLLSPTVFLPPLLRLSSHRASDISAAFRKLRGLYWPPPVPTKLILPERKLRTLIHDDSVPDSGYASAEDDDTDDTEETLDFSSMAMKGYDEALEILRSDTLEREFAIKWVTGFVARSETWAGLSTCDTEQDARVTLLEEAVSILASFGGDDNGSDDEEIFLRTFSFLSGNGKSIRVELNDSIIESDHTSVGLQSWGSAIVLAEKICASPARFSLCTDNVKPLRVLELGAGTGLLSIATAKILDDSSAFIAATDYHVDVLANLFTNVSINFPRDDPVPIKVHTLDWETPVYTSPLDESFDVILAADVIYHPDHAIWIKGCVERLLVRPSIGHPGGVFWMIMALRTTGRHEGLDHTVQAVFPDALDVILGSNSGPILVALENEDVRKLDGVGRADEAGYRLFKIGWLEE